MWQIRQTFCVFPPKTGNYMHIIHFVLECELDEHVSQQLMYIISYQDSISIHNFGIISSNQCCGRGIIQNNLCDWKVLSTILKHRFDWICRNISNHFRLRIRPWRRRRVHWRPKNNSMYTERICSSIAQKTTGNIIMDGGKRWWMT